jgi:cytochrome b
VPKNPPSNPEIVKAEVWDLPTRLFHWLLAALVGFSWWSAENRHLEWHIWSGIAIFTLLVFRLLWGLFGSSTARFANFVRGPRHVHAYVTGTRSWSGPGHTPLGALSVLALLLVTAAQVGLGLFASDEDGLNQGPLAALVSNAASDTASQIHGVLFYVLLALIALHVAAILFYRLVRGKKLVMPMITGGAQLDPGVAPMRPAKAWVAVLCLLVAIGIARWVVAGAPPLGA